MKLDINTNKKNALVKKWKNWAKALKSGEYKKGRGYLKKKNEKGKTQYCCLGCLLDVNGYKGKIEDDHFKFGTNWEEESIMPIEYTNKFGINENGELTELGRKEFKKMFKKRDDYSNLTEINDATKLSFRDIGSFIDAAANHLKETGESYFEYSRILFEDTI